MVDGDDGAAFADALGVHVDGGRGEGRVDFVDGYGVVRIRRATTEIRDCAKEERRGLTRRRRRRRR